MYKLLTDDLGGSGGNWNIAGGCVSLISFEPY